MAFIWYSDRCLRFHLHICRLNLKLLSGFILIVFFALWTTNITWTLLSYAVLCGLVIIRRIRLRLLRRCHIRNRNKLLRMNIIPKDELWIKSNIYINFEMKKFIFLAFSSVCETYKEHIVARALTCAIGSCMFWHSLEWNTYSSLCCIARRFFF